MKASPLRLAAKVMTPFGAIVSLAFMFRVGWRNSSPVLLALFTVWVVGPFVALGAASFISKPWSPRARALFDFLTLVVALGSPLIYGNVAFSAPRAQPASMFLLVPLVSLLAIGISWLLANRGARPSPNEPA